VKESIDGDIQIQQFEVIEKIVLRLLWIGVRDCFRIAFENSFLSVARGKERMMNPERRIVGFPRDSHAVADPLAVRFAAHLHRTT
jgi:hypothetical protein